MNEDAIMAALSDMVPGALLQQMRGEPSDHLEQTQHYDTHESDG